MAKGTSAAAPSAVPLAPTGAPAAENAAVGLKLAEQDVCVSVPSGGGGFGA